MRANDCSTRLSYSNKLLDCSYSLVHTVIFQGVFWGSSGRRAWQDWNNPLLISSSLKGKAEAVCYCSFLLLPIYSCCFNESHRFITVRKKNPEYALICCQLLLSEVAVEILREIVQTNWRHSPNSGNTHTGLRSVRQKGQLKKVKGPVHMWRVLNSNLCNWKPNYI